MASAVKIKFPTLGRCLEGLHGGRRALPSRPNTLQKNMFHFDCYFVFLQSLTIAFLLKVQR